MHVPCAAISGIWNAHECSRDLRAAAQPLLCPNLAWPRCTSLASAAPNASVDSTSGLGNEPQTFKKSLVSRRVRPPAPFFAQKCHEMRDTVTTILGAHTVKHAASHLVLRVAVEVQPCPTTGHCGIYPLQGSIPQLSRSCFKCFLSGLWPQTPKRLTNNGLYSQEIPSALIPGRHEPNYSRILNVYQPCVGHASHRRLLLDRGREFFRRAPPWPAIDYAE